MNRQGFCIMRLDSSTNWILCFLCSLRLQHPHGQNGFLNLATNPATLRTRRVSAAFVVWQFEEAVSY
jgi:hypothetical protein